MCLFVLMLPLACTSHSSNIVSEQEEGQKEGSQEKKSSIQSQHFSDCFEPFLDLVLWGRVSHYRTISYISEEPLQMASADRREDAACITARLVSSCTSTVVNS